MPRKKPTPAPPQAPTEDEDWGGNAADARLSTVRFDTRLVELFREQAIGKLHNLTNEPLAEAEAALVPILNDEYFRARWGAFLDHAGPELIVRLGLEQLLLAVHEARPGRTGIADIDRSRSFKSVDDMLKYVRSDET